MDGFDCLGCDDDVDEIGFDFGSILQAAGGLASAGVAAGEQAKKDQADKSKQDQLAKDAIAADQAAATALATVDLSTQSKSPSLSVDQQALQLALAAEDKAGNAGLGDAAQKKRADAADATLAAVVKSAQKNPKDLNAQALVKAWTTVANKAHAGAISSQASGLQSLGDHHESWITKRVLGPIPGYGVLVLGAGVLGVVGVVLKKFVFKG